MRAIALILASLPGHISAQDMPLRYNSFGLPGLIDMPNARIAEDADLGFVIAARPGQRRGTATFQLSPRVSASFRYAALDDVLGPGDVLYDRVLDRSFSLRYQLLNETALLPALAVGIDDFAGTGLYAGEYLVASKTLFPGLAVTSGLGWGRYGGVGGFANPLGARFADRPDANVGQGGSPAQDTLFRGDAAFFGGLEWQISPQLTAVAEYSSDALELLPSTARENPFNLALSYAITPNLRIDAQSLYGADVGVHLSYNINPKAAPLGGGLDRGPPPAVPVGRRSATDAAIENALDDVGLRVLDIARQKDAIQVTIQNPTYLAAAQAVGRAARVLAAHSTAQTKLFTITLSENGLRGQSVTLPRQSVIHAEFSATGTEELRAATGIGPDARQPLLAGGNTFRIRPYLRPNLFDPDDPLRADFGVALEAEWVPISGWIIRSHLQQKLGGNLDQTTRMSDSVLPRVRSDFALYDREGDADLIELTANIYWQPRPEVTMRLSAGLLEEMYGGVSGEVLWRPAQSAFAFGLELNEVRQRGYQSDLGFRDYQVTTGHASAYWDMGGGYHSQIHLGRYLAGDWGGTVQFSRRFANGWQLGAFATMTDVPFDDFGEGSFDKGIKVDIPLSWLSGRSSRQIVHRTIRPVTRDGGARLDVSGRLYEVTRPLDRRAIFESWGRVLR